MTYTGGTPPSGGIPPIGGIPPTRGLKNKQRVYLEVDSIEITYNGGIPIGGGRPGTPKRPGKPTGPGKAKGAKGRPKINRTPSMNDQVLENIPIGKGGNGKLGLLVL